MNDLTPDELYVLACALDRQREHMYETRAAWAVGERLALGKLISRLQDTLEAAEDRCACIHPRKVHGTSYCEMCACDGWVPR